MTPRVSFVFILNLVAGDWGAVNLKTNYFPWLTRHAAKEQGRGNLHKQAHSKRGWGGGSCWFIALFTPYGHALPGPLTLAEEHFSLLAWTLLPGSSPHFTVLYGSWLCSLEGSLSSESLVIAEVTLKNMLPQPASCQWKVGEKEGLVS